MRRTVQAAAVSLGLAASGLVPGVASAQMFEGAIHYSIRDEHGKATIMVQLTKHGKVSTQFTNNGKTVTIIVDSTAGTTTMVNSEDKSYFVFNRAAMQQMMQGVQGMTRRRGGPDSTRTPQGTITRTGTAVVAGVSCEVYAYEGVEDGKRQSGEVCLAKGFGNAIFTGDMGMMGMRREPGLQDRLRAWGPLGGLLAQGYGFLKITNSENGKPNGTVEVTAVERGAPPDALFQPPAGYTKKSMADMMGHH